MKLALLCYFAALVIVFAFFPLDNSAYVVRTLLAISAAALLAAGCVALWQHLHPRN